MFCTKCGTQLSEGAEFCSKCGTKAGSSANEQNTEAQKSTQGSANNQPVTQATAMPSGTGPLVMGLLGLFGGFIPIVKYITGLLSLLTIFIGASQRKKLKGAGLPTGKATAGIVLGSIAVLITVITIAFTAMVVGALFGNQRTNFSLGSRETQKILGLFNNRTLPSQIQGTTWTNGFANIEFGKNKVKFLDEWHPVDKIEKGSSGSNWMFTWIYFGDHNIRLQSTSDEKFFMDVNGNSFKTTAEMEAQRVTMEKMVGIWSVTGQRNWTADLVIEKTDTVSCRLSGYFEWRGPDNRSGKEYFKGEYDPFNSKSVNARLSA